MFQFRKTGLKYFEVKDTKVLNGTVNSRLTWPVESKVKRKYSKHALKRLQNTGPTDSTKINRPGHNILMYWTNFWQPTAHVQNNILKLLKNFVVHIFTLLLVPLTLKLVHYLRHSESLKYVWKSTISCLRRKMSSISEFFRMFKDSLWRQ